MLHRFILIFSLFLTAVPNVRADVPRLPAKPMRIVSLKPNITKTLMALGAGNAVVGITKFCPRPNETAEVVADYTSVRAESVVRLKPDLVLSSVENSQSRQYEPLSAAGLTVRFLEFGTLDDLFASVSELGKMLGKSTQARLASERMRFGIDFAKGLAEKLRGRTFAVIVQREPLMVAGGTAFVSTLLESAGFSNAFASNRIAYPVLDKESLLAKKPDFLFDMGMARGADWGTDYLGRPTVMLDIEEFLAAPQSVDTLQALLERMTR